MPVADKDTERGYREASRSTATLPMIRGALRFPTRVGLRVARMVHNFLPGPGAQTLRAVLSRCGSQHTEAGNRKP